MKLKLKNSQMPWNKTIKLIWRRDLQREQKISKENKHHPDQTYLRPPSSPFSAPPPSLFFPKKQAYPYATSVQCCFFHFMFGVILKDSIGKMVSISQ